MRVNRKYLEEIIPRKEIFGYYDHSDERWERWDKQIEEYGFCDIETWDLDKAFAQIIYERLSMYLEYADNVVDLSEPKYEVYGVEMTLRDVIEFILWECKKAIRTVNPDTYTEAMDIVWKMMSKIHKHLWW